MPFVVRRTLVALITLVGAVLLNFFLFRAVPGNVSDSFGSFPGMTPAMRRELTAQFGLNKSLSLQFKDYIIQLLHGNLGISFANQEPVSNQVLTALWHTAPLGAAAVGLAGSLGIIAGAVAAWGSGSRADTLLTSIALVLYSAPVQWIGLMLIVWLSGTFAAGGMSDPFLIHPSWSAHLYDYLRHFALPALTLGLAIFGSFMLISRSAVIETLDEDFLLVAAAKGLKHRRLLFRYALRNALLPISTFTALMIGYFVGGTIIVETVYSWPGIGRLLYQAVLGRDYSMLEGGFLVTTSMVVLVTYAVDLSYRLLDPRALEI